MNDSRKAHAAANNSAFVILSLAFFAALLAPLTTTADTEGPYTYTVADGKATITDFSTSFSGALSITNELGGCPVTFIGHYAFFNCASLTNVTIPDSVTTIGEGAFCYCTSLTTVTIPGSVTFIGEVAFCECTSLPSITIPDSVTSIGAWAFAYCTSLASVTIPDSVTTIDDYAFYDCTSLASVTIGNGVTTISYRAFRDCSSLTNIIVNSANPNYSSLDGVLFNKTQTTFIQCPGGKTGSYSIPAGVTTIGYYAFDDCTSLTSVTIPDSVTSIGDYAFSGCTSLASITIPDSVTAIGSSAFYGCTSLTSATIPDSVTAIGDWAFWKCASLTSAYFGGNAPTPGSSVFYTTSATVYYLPGTTGWLATYAGLSTKLWNPAFTGTALTAGAISCTVTGSPPIPIAMEATTNLTTGPWVRICTTNLNDNSLDLHDPDSSSHPARFYRIIGP